MKRSQIKKCMQCEKGVMHSRQVQFYSVSISSMMIDLGAVRRMAGMEMQLGALAQHMGPDEDMATEVTKASFFLCFDCAIENTCVAQLMESATEKENE